MPAEEVKDPFAYRHHLTGEPLYRDGTPIPKSEQEEIYRRHMEAERRRLDEAHGVISSPFDLRGWELVGLSRHKPGVLRYEAQRSTARGMEMKRGFAKDAVFAHLQVPA